MRCKDGHGIVLMEMDVQLERRAAPGMGLGSRVGCGNRLRARHAGRVLLGTSHRIISAVLAIHPSEAPLTAAREVDCPFRGVAARTDSRGACGLRAYSHIGWTAGE